MRTELAIGILVAGLMSAGRLTSQVPSPQRPTRDTTRRVIQQPAPPDSAQMNARASEGLRRALIPRYVVEYQLFLEVNDQAYRGEPAPWLRITLSDSAKKRVNPVRYYIFRFTILTDVDNVGGTISYAIPYQTAAAAMVALLRDAAVSGKPVFVSGTPIGPFSYEREPAYSIRSATMAVDVDKDLLGRFNALYAPHND